MCSLMCSVLLVGGKDLGLNGRWKGMSLLVVSIVLLVSSCCGWLCLLIISSVICILLLCGRLFWMLFSVLFSLCRWVGSIGLIMVMLCEVCGVGVGFGLLLE